MEQCRKAGKSHWYHETQSTMSSQTTLSLMPEAAYVNDRFLLDLAVSETALAPFESWLKPARQLADILFPRTVFNDRLHTFSAYERMSTALTAAQVFGVQRLCRHYAAIMPRVWRRYLALTPQERAINGWRKLRNTLVSLPVLPPLSTREPVNSLQRWD